MYVLFHKHFPHRESTELALHDLSVHSDRTNNSELPFFCRFHILSTLQVSIASLLVGLYLRYCTSSHFKAEVSSFDGFFIPSPLLYSPLSFLHTFTFFRRLIWKSWPNFLVSWSTLSSASFQRPAFNIMFHRCANILPALLVHFCNYHPLLSKF